MSMSEGERINCRARKSPSCEHGKPTGASGMDSDGDGMCEDGTWDGETVLCTACYIATGMPVCNANPGSVWGGKGTPGR